MKAKIKQAPKLESEVLPVQTVASPKLKLSTQLADTHLTSSRELTPPKNSRYTDIPHSNSNTLNLDESARVNETNQYQARKAAAEQELANENKLLLGLMLIFVTGLVIAYSISRYRSLI